MKYFLIIFIFLPSLFFGQSAFSDVTLNSGIDNIYDVYEGLFGGGVVAFDYNNDGFEDLYITGGKSQDVLYRNNGDGTFKDVINRSGLLKDSLIVTTGVSSADVNKDGYIDLLVTTITSQNNHPNEKNKMSLIYYT